jgi:type I restriction enzyme, S subunit
MKLNRYPKYKPTGIPWLPEIPEGWEVKKVRQLAREGKTKNKGNAEKNVLSLSYGRIIRKKDIYSGLAPTDFATYQIVEKDYVVLRLTDLQNDHRSLRCGLVHERGIITSAYVSLIPQNVLPEYLYLALHTCDLNKVFYSMGGGLRQSMNFADVGNIFIPVPPLAEQRAIVAYLDEKCGKVNRLVAAKEREVALLKELKQSMIAEAVTRGVRANRRLVPSGIPWLPEIPEGWEVRRLKSLFSLRHEAYSPNERLIVLSLIKDVGVIPYDEKGAVGNKSKEDIAGYNVARKGDIVMNSMNVIIGSVDITPYDGYISPAYYALTPRESVESKYFNYLFHLRAVQKTMRSLAKGILEIRLRISTTSLFGMAYPVPPLAEQREIVAHIEARAAKIDAAVAGLEKEIAALKEYKQRLIADVVTGQRKVA